MEKAGISALTVHGRTKEEKKNFKENVIGHWLKE